MKNEVFDRLRQMTKLRFSARSASEDMTGWNGEGSGQVTVEEFAENVLIYRESGVWRQDSGKEFRFTNVFRWTALTAELLRLDHLRLGDDNPVFLFDLIPEESAWVSAVGHPCRTDCYTGRLELLVDGFRFLWKVEGRRRHDTIDYHYS